MCVLTVTFKPNQENYYYIDLKDKDGNVIDRVGFLDAKLEKSAISKILQYLISKRKEQKKIMKDKSKTELERFLADLFQQAYKLGANGLYGLLGSEHSIISNKKIAHCVTTVGQYQVKNLGDFCKSKGCDLIAGDTDSVMININYVTKDVIKRFYPKFINYQTVDNVEGYKQTLLEFYEQLVIESFKEATVLCEEYNTLNHIGDYPKINLCVEKALGFTGFFSKKHYIGQKFKSGT
ncbi:hypothetical protein C2G38_1990530 [Gigaspora rosea]|uniref:DNA-directed DNA polymerase n=1 Tax=Gigaspora rosea TaxID=44941 RepID=A0A397U2L3_9GLOM|nr:hypothetical protein C2G38_1990530 [Gigaspora rosea]